MRPTGDLVDRQESGQPTSPNGTCRVPGLIGLEQRRAPLDAAVFPKSLLEWASACPSSGHRHAETAPAIYCLDVDGAQPYRLLAGSKTPDTSVEQRDKSIRSARHRLVPATYSPANSPEDAPAASRPKLLALTPRQVAVLGHVLAHVKYPLWGSHLLPCSTGASRFRLTINAGAMIERLGFARGGDAYRALEDDLAALCQFLVRHETREDGNWRVGAASPLLSYLHTGRCSVESGQRSDINNSRRDEQWIIELGSSLLTLLRAGPENMSVMGAGLWAAASRSRIDQWLALWVSGHGYDSGQIYEYRVETLARRMRLLPDSVAATLEQSARVIDDVSAKAASYDPWSSTAASVRRPADAETGSADALSLTQALSQARGYWRQIRRSITRLEERNGIERGEWRHSQQAPDVRPSQSGRALSRVDLIRLHRWSGPVEGILPRARRFVAQQWGDLLSSLNGAFTKLGEMASVNGPLAAWASEVRRRHQEKLEWLKAGSDRLSRSALLRVKQSLSTEMVKLALFSPERFRLAFLPAKPRSLSPIT